MNTRESFELFFSSHDGAVLMLDSEWRIESANPAAEAAFGGGDNLSGRPLSSLFSREEDYRDFIIEAAGVLREGRLKRTDRSLTGPDGIRRRYRIMAAPLGGGMRAITDKRLLFILPVRPSAEEGIEIINAILGSILAGKGLKECMEDSVIALVDLVGADGGSIGVLSEDERTVSYPFNYRLPQSLCLVSVPVGRGIAWETMERGIPGIVEDYPSLPGALPEFIEAGLTSLIVLPLFMRGRFRATIGLFSLDPGHKFTTSDLERVEPLANTVAIILENARLIERLRYLTDYRNAMIEEAPLLVLAARPNGEIILFNNLASTALGYSPDEVMGRSFEGLHPPDRLEEVRHLFELHREGGLNRIDVPFRTKGGEIKTIRLAQTIIDTPGHEAVLLAFGRDMTELLELEERAARSERLATVGTLAAGLSHEFANSVAAMRGYAELAIRDPEDARIAETLRDVVMRHTDRCGELIKRMSLLLGPAKKKRIICNAAAAVRDLLGEMADEFEAGGVRVSLDAPETAEVRLDAATLSEIMRNLLVNARHAVEDSARKEVSVAIEGPIEGPPAGAILIRVSDTGSGMDGRTQKRIFDPFFTTKGALGGRIHDGKRTGTGLGLSIVEAALRAYGGRIAVTSAPGEGTVFSLTLPPGRDDAAREAAKDKDGPSIPDAPNS